MLRSRDHLAALQTKCYTQGTTWRPCKRSPTLRGSLSAHTNKRLRSRDHLAPLQTKTTSPTTTKRQGTTGNHRHKNCIAATRHRIATMPILLQGLSVLRQRPYCCNASAHFYNASFNARICCNVAPMLMVCAMPFNITATHIAATLKRIAAMVPLLHHCGNVAIARCIAAMPFGTAATPKYFPDARGLFAVETPPNCPPTSADNCS